MPDWASVALAVAGAVVVAIALLWRVRARRRAARLLRDAITDPDPAVRRAAIVTAGAQGLAQYADVLAERARLERDPAVRRALADVVARSQWEPADREDIVSLRLWARRELDLPRAAQGPDLPVVTPGPGTGDPAAAGSTGDATALVRRVAEVLGERVLDVRLEAGGRTVEAHGLDA